METRSGSGGKEQSDATDSAEPEVAKDKREGDADDDDEERILDTKRKTKVVEESPKGRYVRFNEKLGEGAFKKVYRAWDTTNGVEVAWNSVKMSTLHSRDGGKRILQEMKILQQLDHPNIIKFHASWLNKEEQTLVFITEIITTGTLKAFTQTRPVRLKILKRWCRHILGAIVYLHSFDPPIIHRDLKCDNIFINGSTGDIRIGDLGLASWQRDGAPQSCLGTPEYMAPELYEEEYDEQVDIYAFGMCVLEMITKQTPYQECTSAPQIYRKVIQGILPLSFSMLRDSPTTEFIRWCIGKPKEGQKRPTARQLLESPYLEKPEEEEDGEGNIDCADFLKTAEEMEAEGLALFEKQNPSKQSPPSTQVNENQTTSKTSPKSPTSQLPRKKAESLFDKPGSSRENGLRRRTTAPSYVPEPPVQISIFNSRIFATSETEFCLELITPKRTSIKCILQSADTANSITNELVVEGLIDFRDFPQVEAVLDKTIRAFMGSRSMSDSHIAEDNLRRMIASNGIIEQVQEVAKEIQSAVQIKELHENAVQIDIVHEEKLREVNKLREIEEKLTGEYSNFLANR